MRAFLFEQLVFEQVPLGTVFRRRGFPPLVLSTPRHRRLLCRREGQRHHGHGELLYSAVDRDAPSCSQVPESGLLVLQRLDDDTVEPADGRRSGHGKERRFRRFQRSRFDGE